MMLARKKFSKTSGLVKMVAICFLLSGFIGMIGKGVCERIVANSPSEAQIENGYVVPVLVKAQHHFVARSTAAACNIADYVFVIGVVGGVFLGFSLYFVFGRLPNE